MTQTIEDLIIKIRQEERQKALIELQSLVAEKEIPARTVMAHIKECMESTGLPIWRYYQLQNAISVIVRHVLAVERLAQLNQDQTEIAITIADAVIDVISVNRK